MRRMQERPVCAVNSKEGTERSVKQVLNRYTCPFNTRREGPH